MAERCTVWFAAPIDPDTAPGLVELLDPLEVGRLGKFRRAEDRGLYLAAHALTRLALAHELDADPAALVFDRTCRCGEQHGKPVLVDGGPAFSLSHSGSFVAVAVSPGVVGVDVERGRTLTDLDAMAQHSCAPGETVRTPEEFFRLWTRKEALLKLTGDGLSAPMSDIALGPDGVRSWSGPHAPAGPVWLHDLRPDADHHAAVAGLGATAPAVTEADGNALLHGVAAR